LETSTLLAGIEVFFRLNSHSRVPMRFVVPAEEPWPMEIWGHKLGSRIAQMRMTGERKTETEKDGERI
ncbi:unnamed protein product, partial [Hapterophycus canaliculatus]